MVGELQAFKARFFKALAHPIRIRLIELLVERDRSVQELQVALGADQSRVSQHLAVLRTNHVVTAKKQGTTARYALRDPLVGELLAVARRIFTGRVTGTQDMLRELHRERGADVSLFAKILKVGLATEPLDPAGRRPSSSSATSRRGRGASSAGRWRSAGRRRIVQRLRARDQRPHEPVYDIERFGVTSWRRPGTRTSSSSPARDPQHGGAAPEDVQATPDPKLVVAVGDCRTCGVFRGSYAVAGSVDQIIPVDAFVSGCPPEPADIIRGILAALDRLSARPRRQ